MQFIVAAIIGGLASGMASIVGRLLLTLGVGFVTYQGVDLALEGLRTTMVDSFQFLPAEIASFLGWLWVDKAINLIFSATAAAAAIKLGQGGSITKMEIK